MLIIAAANLTDKAKEKLSSFGDVLEFSAPGLAYPAISSHPDIFFCQSGEKLFVAPNLPVKYFEILDRQRISYVTGELPVGPEYPLSARYNAVATGKFLIHNFRHTDFSITRALEDLEPVHVDQGYCRCNLLPLKDGHFITSDEGIYKVLKRLHLNILYVPPKGIVLEGFPNGFFGGCFGVWGDKVFVNGGLDHFPEGDEVRKYLDGLGYEIIGLTSGPMNDLGSILFVIK